MLMRLVEHPWLSAAAYTHGVLLLLTCNSTARHARYRATLLAGSLLASAVALPALQVWVYEPAGPDSEANAYVHHDYMLPAFPLCLAWGDCRPGGSSEPANLAAVGLMTPGIELWDLDAVEAVEPVAVLGGEEASGPAGQGCPAVVVLRLLLSMHGMAECQQLLGKSPGQPW